MWANRCQHGRPRPFHRDQINNSGLKTQPPDRDRDLSRLEAGDIGRPFGPHPLFGAGVDDLHWLKPVRPGDTLRLEGELVELVPSRTKPQGVARIKWTAYNQHGEAVYTFNPIGIVPRRPA
jgi:acyl dehydratase